MIKLNKTIISVQVYADTINSEVHNFQKLKDISLKAVNFLATNTKVTCLSESVFFSSSYFGVTATFTAMWVILSERLIT